MRKLEKPTQNFHLRIEKRLKIMYIYRFNWSSYLCQSHSIKFDARKLARRTNLTLKAREHEQNLGTYQKGKHEKTIWTIVITSFPSLHTRIVSVAHKLETQTRSNSLIR